MPIVSPFAWVRRGYSLLPIVSLVGFLAAPSPLAAQPVTAGTTLQVDQALERLRRDPAFQANVEARLSMAEGIALSEGRWPNPEIVYQREVARGIYGDTEEYLLLSQRFELSGRLGLLSTAAEIEARAERLRIQAEGRQLQVELLGHFYEALYTQSRMELLEQWMLRLARILETVKQRHAAGDVSGYDRARVEAEAASIRRNYQAAGDAFAQARKSLVGLLAYDEPSFVRVAGTLAPVAETGLPEIDVFGLPEIAAYRFETEANEARMRASRRWWLPALNLQAGLKRVAAGANDETGYAASAGLELPLFDRNQGPYQVATGKARLAASQRIRQARLLAARHDYLTQDLEKKLAALREFSAAEQHAGTSLLRSAEAAYLAGEFGVVELLDGYRMHFQEALEELELSWRARQTWLALIEISGLPAGKDLYP
jgi:outer membrane protein, heavy metal efflux system